MLILLSPAKTLDFETSLPPIDLSQPALEDQALPLIKRAREMSASSLSSLMGISDKLAQLNAERFKAWQPGAGYPVARPAILAFNGDVYEGLAATSLNAQDIAWAQDRLRMLSGLYGVLRPLDALQPYRLEMGTRLSNPRGQDLYHYWGHRVTQSLNQDLSALKGRGEPAVTINLASEEYFKVVCLNDRPVNDQDVTSQGLQGQLVSPVFQDAKGSGDFKIVSFYAKRARGLMARYIVQNRLTKAEDLRGFDLEGYRFDPAVSTIDRPVFRRRQD
ncbi:MAG: peroxide stress protein YaaA [Burkholderiaceae bacterium]